MTRAVVFAYHNVGVRCLEVLLAHGVAVPLVITHADNPTENIWFDSVAALAEKHDIPFITPADPNASEVIESVRAARPDFLFSFYYRHMLKPELLALPTRGAYNMHGSLLPHYRGRVPVNWAVLNGETQTGATLHSMVEKPDAGKIVAQSAVPILPNDSAHVVFGKVTVAAEIALDKVLPQLLAGTAPHLEQDLSRGSYYSGRKPEDGRIDWAQPAAKIHNLVRAVAPPYPGAFCDLAGHRLQVFETLIVPPPSSLPASAALFFEGEKLYARCADGQCLKMLACTVDGLPLTASNFTQFFGPGPLPLTS